MSGAHPRRAGVPSGTWRFSTTSLAALVLGIVVALALFHRALFGGETFVMRDLLTFSRPLRSLAVPLAQASGGLPLWNPHLNSGQPYAANPQNGFFHPATLLFFAFPFDPAFRALVILPTLVAAAGMHALLRRLGRSRAGCAFGALAFGFGGYTLSMTNHLPMCWAMSVVPAAMAGAAACARRGSRPVAGLALAFGLVALAGEPSVLIMTPPLLAAAWLAARARTALAVRGSAASGLGRMCVGLALGAALAAVVLLPAWALAGKTARAAGLPEEMAGSWSMPAARLADLVAPAILAGLDEGAGRAHWARLYPGHFSALAPSLYPGLLATLCAVIGLGAPRARGGLWLGVALAGVLLASGSHGPLWPLVNRLPLLASVRYPEKFVLLGVVAGVVVASAGFDRLVFRFPGVVRRAALALAMLCALALPGWAIARPQASPFGTSILWTPRLGAWLLCTAAAHALVLTLVWTQRRRIPRGARAAILLSLLAADLVVAGRPLVPTQPQASVAAVPALLRPLVDRPPGGPLFDAAARTARHAARPPLPALWRIATTLEPDADFTQLRWSADASEAVWGALQADPALGLPLLRRRGVGAILQLAPGVRASDPFTLRAPPGLAEPIQLVRLTEARAFACVGAVERVAGIDGWREAVARLGPAVEHTALVDAGLLASEDLPMHPGPCRAEPLALGPTRVAIDVEAEGPEPSFLALNRTWDDGWKARVDGQPVPLLRVDLSLSGLAVPPGRHRVELAYDERQVTFGLGLSLAALAAIAVLALRRSPVSLGA